MLNRIKGYIPHRTPCTMPYAPPHAVTPYAMRHDLCPCGNSAMTYAVTPCPTPCPTHTPCSMLAYTMRHALFHAICIDRGLWQFRHYVK